MKRSKVFLFGILATAAVMILAACGGDDPTPTPKKAAAPAAAPTAPTAPAVKSTGAVAKPANTPTPTAVIKPTAVPGYIEDWAKVEAAALAEGEVTVITSGESAQVLAQIAAFEAKYPGIDVTSSIVRCGEAAAVMAAEAGAGKVAMDIYSGGCNRALDGQGFGQSTGMLEMPVRFETAGDVWAIDPWKDVAEGTGNVLFATIGANVFLANNKLCPVSNCPASYADLADPKWADMEGGWLLYEPIGATSGSFIMGLILEEYGEKFAGDLIRNNVDATTRSHKGAEEAVARGEFAFYVTGKSPVQTWKLPEPRPLRPIAPADGTIVSVSGWLALEGNPHPNAALLFMNYSLTHEGQQARADVPAAGFIRKDVTAVEPALTYTGGKLFPRVPITLAFAKEYPSFTPIYEAAMKDAGLK